MDSKQEVTTALAPSRIDKKLTPLEYQSEVAGYLEKEEPGLWASFSSRESLNELAEATRLSLLKSTVRLTPESHARAYDAAKAAAAALGLDVPVHVYQGPQGDGGLNASLFYLPDEAHVVLFGPILDRLDDQELRALFGHELAHHLLWGIHGGKFWIADRLLDANAHHGGAEPSHLATAERFQLYTELFADRGGALAAGANEPAISLLLKVKTGLTDPDVRAYRDQVADLLKKGPMPTEGGTHPEAFIRVRALDAWLEGDEDIVDKMVRGELRLDTLDCLSQRVIEGLTRDLIGAHLGHRWLQTEATIGQVRLLWTDFKQAESAAPSEQALAGVKASDQHLHDYWCYLLLDLAVADRDLEDMGVLAGQLTAEQLGMRERFETVAAKELKLTKKRLGELWAQRERLAAAAESTLDTKEEAVQ